MSFRIPLLSTYFHVLHSSAGTIDLSAVYRWTDFGDVLFTAVIRPFVTMEDKANARRIVVRFLALNYSKPKKRSLYCQVSNINDQIDATLTILFIFESAQYVSGNHLPIFRSVSLWFTAMWCIVLML